MSLAAALRVAYDGGRFDAFARAPGRRTVEQALIDAARQEGYIEGTWRSGSRTDAGVSALENVVTLRLGRPHLQGLAEAMQRHLPPGLFVTGIAAGDFDPRRAHRRHYRFIHVGDEDDGRMKEAAVAFVGRHDFSRFARLEPGRDPLRTIHAVDVRRAGPIVTIDVEGQAFLWHQVRRMVSALLAVGAGRATMADIVSALGGRSKHPSFGLAPASGLLLLHVEYPGVAWQDSRLRIVRSFIQQATVGQTIADHLKRFNRSLGRTP